METDSGSEGLDIALFSKKFKVSQEKLNELELKTKTKKNKMKAKDKVKDSNSNSSNRTKDKYELLDRANDDKLDENTENSSVKFQEKPIKRKHKHSEKLDSENVSSPLRKTKYKSENNDNVVEEDGLSPKKRKKTEKEHRSSVINRSLRLPTSKKEQNKLNETIGTSSEESDLETDSFRRKVFNNRVKSKVNQKDIKEKVTKSLKDKNNAEAESDYSDDSERVIVASPSDSESSDGETDQGQESDAETSEMKPEKKLVLNKSNKKVIRQRKDAMSNATIQSNEAKLVKGNGKKKTEALERDSSSDSSTDTSDSKETDNESLESDSDNIRNSTDSEPSKVEKSGAKKLLRKGGKDVIPERKKRRKELPDVDEDNVTVDSVQEEDKDPYVSQKKR